MAVISLICEAQRKENTLFATLGSNLSTIWNVPYIMIHILKTSITGWPVQTCFRRNLQFLHGFSIMIIIVIIILFLSILINLEQDNFLSYACFVQGHI